MMKALEGIRVIDLTTAFSGPVATMQLADHGAEVIKIENNKTGDPSRTWTPFVNGKGAWYPTMNRNKKSISLNLRTDEGKRILLELVKTADVVVENYKGGTMEKMGLGYEVMKSVKPDIIMASLCGYGQTGPYKNQGAYSNLAEAMAGTLYLTGFPDGMPCGSGVAFGDSVGGVFTALGILTALIHRNKTGEGQYIDVSMTDSLVHLSECFIGIYTLTGEEPKRMGNRDAAAFPYDLFEAKDGYCILSITNVNDWTPFAKAVGLEHLIDDLRFDTNKHRIENQNELFPLINEWSKQRTRAEIEKIFMEAGQAYSPVLKISEVIENEQVKARDMIIDMEDPDYGKYKIQGVPVKLSLTPGSVDTPAPSIGQHNEEIYTQIGITPEQIAGYKEQGVM